MVVVVVAIVVGVGLGGRRVLYVNGLRELAHKIPHSSKVEHETPGHRCFVLWGTIGPHQ